MTTKRQRKIDREFDQAVHTWQSPQALASAIGVARLTVYRWIEAGRVERKVLAPRCVRVRLSTPARTRTRTRTRTSTARPQPQSFPRTQRAQPQSFKGKRA